MSRKNIIILLITIIWVVAAGYYFFSYRPQKEEILQMETKKNLEAKIKEALDPNTHFNKQDRCVRGESIPVTGVISNKGKDFLYVKPSREERETEVKLTPKTLFLKMVLSADEKLISQEEITWADVKEGESVVVNAFCEEDKPDEYLASVVKIIIYQR